MRIGDLAKGAGVTVETVRFYETAKLLPPPDRTAANYRSYGPGHADRLRFIVNCRALDMTLDEIRSLLTFHDDPGDNCGGVSQLLDDHLCHVEERLTELRHLQKQLKQLRRACSSPTGTQACGILKSLQSDSGPRVTPGTAHARSRGR